MAYRALTEEGSKENWEMYGHPDGKQTQSIAFALPGWLLHPTGNVALVLVVLYLAMFAGLAYYVIQYTKQTTEKERKNLDDQTVAEGDFQYLAEHLRPDSTPLHVLFYLATTPESLRLTHQQLVLSDEMRASRVEFLKPKNQTKKVEKEAPTDEFGMDDGGWADDDDDDDDPHVQAEKKAAEEKATLANAPAYSSKQPSASPHPPNPTASTKHSSKPPPCSKSEPHPPHPKRLCGGSNRR